MSLDVCTGWAEVESRERTGNAISDLELELRLAWPGWWNERHWVA
jgi:hypothetical protein